MCAAYTHSTPLLENGVSDSELSSPMSVPKTHATPLVTNSSAPIATSEVEEDALDDREVVSTPYPGIDDGFFDNTNNKTNTDVDKFDPLSPPNPDIEVTGTETPGEIPTLSPRLGPGSDDPPSDDKPGTGTRSFTPIPNKPNSLNPGFHFDIEGSSVPGDFDQSIPDFNIYQHKKTLAQGMMDLALFSANANQLRYVLESYARHPYYYPSVIFIVISLLLQVAVGVGLIWNATYNVKDEKEICIANKINNFTVIGIFLVTIVNVFISAFGVANPVPST